MISIITKRPKPKGFVRFKVHNLKTGEVNYVNPNSWKPIFTSKNIDDFLDNLRHKLRKFGKNTATYDARLVAAHLLEPRNPDPYKLTGIEWGYGSTIPVDPRDISDLDGPFETPVITTINSYSYPTTDGNVLKIVSTLTDEELVFPEGGPEGTPYIREVGLRTDPVGTEAPKGYLVARFVTDVDIPKSSTFLHITIEWLYIYN
jgi:hypothetical protein